MNTQNDTNEPIKAEEILVGVETENEFEELNDALDMPDSEYIKHLEQHIVDLSETNRFGHEAIQTFVDLLDFIGENFGNTLDFPIRVDDDFYTGLFSDKLASCQSKIEEFLEAHDETDMEEIDLDDDEIF